MARFDGEIMDFFSSRSLREEEEPSLRSMKAQVAQAYYENPEQHYPT